MAKPAHILKRQSFFDGTGRIMFSILASDGTEIEERAMTPNEARGLQIPVITAAAYHALITGQNKETI